MQKNHVKSDLDKFLIDVKLKKQYINKLQSKVSVLRNITKNKGYKDLSSILFPNNEFTSYEDSLVLYIVDVTFSRTNTLLHIMDFSGKLKFFSSAGLVKYTGKSKKARFSVFRDLYRFLFTKLKGLGSKPIALHLRNVGSHKFWIIEKLKKKLYIKIIKSFNSYPFNGCRKKKVKRKKF
jgi:ribosomal protein S11